MLYFLILQRPDFTSDEISDITCTAKARSISNDDAEYSDLEVYRGQFLNSFLKVFSKCVYLTCSQLMRDNGIRSLGMKKEATQVCVSQSCGITVTTAFLKVP